MIDKIFPKIHNEGYKFIVIFVVATIILYFIHGFLGLDNENIVIYSCTNYRNKNSEIGINWNDKDLKINWNIKSPILSKKDKNNFKFEDVRF